MSQSIASLSEVLPTRYELIRSLKSDISQRPVWLVYDQVRNSRFVLKGLWHNPQQVTHSEIIKEFNLLREFAHPNLPQVDSIGLSQVTHSGNFQLSYFIQEYVAGPSLAQLKGQLDFSSITQCLEDLLNICSFLHQYQLVSLDIKSEHIILRDNKWYLIDLDQVRAYTPLESSNATGTIPYMAPELKSGSVGTKESDIFSLGVVIYEAITGLLPVQNRIENRIEFPASLECWINTPDFYPLCTFIQAAIQYAPESRPQSIGQLHTVLPQHIDQRRPLKLPTYQCMDHLLQSYATIQKLHRGIGGSAIEIESVPNSGKSRFVQELILHHQKMGHPALHVRILNPYEATLSANEIERFLSAYNTPSPDLISSGIYHQKDSKPQSPNTSNLLIAVEAKSISLLPALVRKLALGAIDFDLSILICHDDHYQNTGWTQTFLAPPQASTEAIQSLMTELWQKPQIHPSDLPELLGFCNLRFGLTLQAVTLQHIAPLAHEKFWQYQATDQDGHILKELSSAQLELLAAVSLAGPHASYQLVTTVFDNLTDGQDRHSSIIPSLFSCSLLSITTRNGLRVFELRLPTIKQLVSSKLDTKRKALIHFHIATYLSRLHSSTSSIRTYDIGYHYFHSEQPNLSLSYLATAQLSAQRDCTAPLELEIVGMLLLLQAQNSHAYNNLLIRQACLYHELDLISKAQPILLQLVQNSASLTSEQLFNSHLTLGKTLLREDRLNDAIQQFQYSLNMIQMNGISEDLKVTCALALINCLQRLGQFSEATTTLAEFERIIENCSPSVQISYTLKKLELCLDQKLLTEFTTEQVDKLVATTPQSVTPAIYSRCLSSGAGFFYFTNQVSRALEILEIGITWARKYYYLGREITFISNKVNVLQSTGDFDGAILALNRAIQISQQIGKKTREAKLYKKVLFILQETHAPILQLKVYNAKLGELLTNSEDPRVKLAHRISSAYIRLREHDHDDLKLELEAIVNRSLELQLWNHAASALRLICELHLVSNNLPIAWRHLSQIESISQQVDSKLILHQVHKTASQTHQLLAKKYKPKGLKQNTEPESNNLAIPQSFQFNSTSSFGEDRDGNRLADLTQWKSLLNTLIQSTYDEKILAAHLARTVGDMLRGRGLVILFMGRKTQAIQTHNMNEFDSHEISSNVVKWVRESGEPIHKRDIHLDTELNAYRSIRQGQAKSLLCWPIKSDDKMVGVIYVDTKESTKTNPDWAEGLVSMVAELAGQLLHSLSLTQYSKADDTPIPGLLGISPAMVELRKQIHLLARHPDPEYSVLILGKPGTGKSQIAKILHNLSPRHTHPFVTVNTPALAHGTGESELFGHKRGAFTGAIQDRKGCFERAAQGTVFFDEVGDMGMEAQNTLLIALGQRMYSPMGGSHEKELTSALIWATNRDIDGLIESEKMRADFVDRIWVNTIRVPSLRERGPDDVAILLAACIQSIRAGKGLALHKFSPDLVTAKRLVFDQFTRAAGKFLLQYHWPGNVRQLVNVFRNAQIAQAVTNELSVDLPTLRLILARKVKRVQTVSESDVPLPAPGLSWKELGQYVDRIKEHYISRAYIMSQRNQSKLAQIMNTTRPTVKKFINPDVVSRLDPNSEDG